MNMASVIDLSSVYLKVVLRQRGGMIQERV
jgi:hypothetical protein